MEKYLKYSVEEFSVDKDFTDWVLKPTKELHKRWTHFLQEHPEKEQDLRKARLIVRSLIPIENDVQEKKLNDIWLRVYQSRRAGKIRTLRLFAKYAAVLIVTLCLSVIAYYQLRQGRFDNELTKVEPNSKGKIILADGSVHYFEAEQNIMTQLSSGKLTLNQDTITETDIEDKSKGSLNQVIVPYGKRIELVLSDGSHVWLNSGSKFSYPSKFETKSREVYLLGEAFLEIAKNVNCPFFVNTPDIKISVTGTKFNVSSYNDDAFVKTVLVEGSVHVQQNKLFAKSITLSPGEKAVFIKDNRNIFKAKADTDESISWIYGYLIFNKEPVSEVLKKLGRYYNRSILVSDDIIGVTFSGKLDLKDNMDEVISDLAFASSLKIIKKNGDTYYVKP